MKKFLITSLCFFLVTGLAIGQDASQKAGMTGAKFLSVPIGGRAAAMGQAYAGLSSDGSAVFWNVAGIAIQPGSGIFTSHTKWPADINFNAVALNFDVGSLGKLGVQYQVMNVGEMRVRTPYAPEGTGEMFRVQSMAAGVSWAKSLTDQFSMGLTFKYIQEDFTDLLAEGWAIDIGSLYDTRWRGLKIGMSMSNFGPDIAFDGMFSNYSDLEEIGRSVPYDEYSLPLTFRFGIKMDVMEFSNNTKWILATDAIHPPDNNEKVNFGTEFLLMDMFALRAGYAFGANEGGLTAGVGVNVPFVGLTADMSYGDFGLLGSITNISLGFTL